MESSTFSLHPYNEHDPFYSSLVRKNLSTFHTNLSHGLYDSNGPLVSPSLHWNANGQLLISRSSFVSQLKKFKVPFDGLQAPDIYRVVDGHVGAIMYRIHGPQTGDFGAFKLPEAGGRSIDVLAGELMLFDEDALLWDLTTVREMIIAEYQLGINRAAPSPVASLTLMQNPQTSPQFRERSRRIMRSIHENFNARDNGSNSKLVSSDVTVIAGSYEENSSTGPEAFVKLIGRWQESFPDMVYHDDATLADGRLGAVEWVWQGTLTGSYSPPPPFGSGSSAQTEKKSIRLRGFFFFEFEEATGLIEKVVGVWDEGAILKQLAGKDGQAP